MQQTIEQQVGRGVKLIRPIELVTLSHTDYLAFFAAVKEKSQDLSPEDQWFGQDVFTPEEQATLDKLYAMRRSIVEASGIEQVEVIN